MRRGSGEERGCSDADACAAHGFDEGEPLPRKPRALAGHEPDIAPVALLGEPHAALVAGDLEGARRLEAHELALREIESEAFAVELHRT